MKTTSINTYFLRNVAPKDHRFCSLRLLLFTAVVALLCSCGKTRHAPLNVSEMFFGKRLSSVSADPRCANRFFVASEDGDVFVLTSSNTTTVDTLFTPFDRIYKVVPCSEAHANGFFIGTRNMGLVLCRRQADSLVAVTRYLLPTADRPDRYSAYDISVQPTGVYVATSHGLLKVTPNIKASTATASTATAVLSPVDVCHDSGTSSDTLRPMVTCDILAISLRYLVCASDRGVLKVDMTTDKVNPLVSQKAYGIALNGNAIMALVSGDSLLKVDLRGNRLAAISLPHPAQRYFYDSANAMNYLLSDGHVQLFRDNELARPDTWQQMNVGMSMPVNCRNIIVGNSGQHQSLLVGKYSLFRVANHQDVFNSTGEVRLACAEGRHIYYLVGTRLFRQDLDGRNEAVQLKDISGGTGDIRFMQVLNGQLFYVDSDNKAYSAPLHSSYLINSLLSFDRPVKPSLNREVTAMGVDASNVYVGIRDGLRNLHRADSCLDNSVFITRFANGGAQTAFATLNDGVFMGRDNRFLPIKGSRRFAFIRDVAFIPSQGQSPDLYVLTNNSLLRSRGTDSLTFVRTATGYRRLLAADSTHVYGVADFGIDNLLSSERLFPDIHFEPEACVVVDGKIYASSGSGVYVFGPTAVKTAPDHYTTVRFVPKSLFSRTNIVLLVLLVCAVVACVWYGDRRRRRMRAVRAMQERLRARVDELCRVSHLLDAHLCSTLDRWDCEIKNLHRLAPTEAVKQADSLNRDIQQASFKVPTVLALQLERQLGDLKTRKKVPSSKERKTASEQAREGGDVFEMARAIVDNDKWLRIVRDDEALVESLCLLFDNHVAVKGMPYSYLAVLNSEVEADEKLYNLYAVVANDKKALEDKVAAETIATAKAAGKTTAKDVAEARDTAKAKVEAEHHFAKTACELLKPYVSTPGIAEKLLAYVEAERQKLQEHEADVCAVDHTFKDVCTVLTAQYSAIVSDLSSSTPDVCGALSQLPLLNRRRDMLLSIVDVHQLSKVYFDLQAQLYKKACLGKQKAEIEAQMKALATDHFSRGTLVEAVQAFYAAADKTVDKELFFLMNLPRKKGGGLFISESLLVLLMAKNGKRVSSYDEMTEAGKQHLRRVRRELLGDNMPACLDRLKAYGNDNAGCFAPLLLDLYETYKADASNTSADESVVETADVDD
mgnify:CR=1 FL=1